MNTAVVWFLMLMPPAGDKALPTYVKAYPDAVSCQVRVIELREEQPTKTFTCRALKGIR